MLSILTKIKNSINFLNRGSVNKTKQNSLYNSQRMFVNDSDDSNKESRSSESIQDNNNIPIIRYLFKTPLTKDTIDTDYELQELIKLVELYVKVDLSDLVLDSKFETCIRDISSEITKVKMRLFYIIIANNIYKHTFEEKKLYAPDKTKHLTGVFRYSGYIFRIDESPYSLMDEQHAVLRIKELTEKNKNIQQDEYSHIILPFVSYVNIKRNDKGHICDCRTVNCSCVYEEPDVYADADVVTDTNNTHVDYSRKLYNIYRENTISFSIQHYVKDTTPLMYWVRDNITNYAYNPFAGTQKQFFVHLFYKCAELLEKIHTLSIVHGDIKPDNILIKEDPDFNLHHPERCKKFTVYLIDFGLSGLDGKGFGTGGTIPYCHPEFKNIRDTNKSYKYKWAVVRVKHDVWSLGLMFLTLYVYRDFYSYYYKYPNYFFTSYGYVSSLIMDTIADDQIHTLFIKMLTDLCVPVNVVCEHLRIMMT